MLLHASWGAGYEHASWGAGYELVLHEVRLGAGPGGRPAGWLRQSVPSPLEVLLARIRGRTMLLFPEPRERRLVFSLFVSCCSGFTAQVPSCFVPHGSLHLLLRKPLSKWDRGAQAPDCLKTMSSCLVQVQG